MITNEEYKTLETIINREGLDNIVDEISAICFSMSEDCPSYGWLAAGEFLEKCAENQVVIKAGQKQ